MKKVLLWIRLTGQKLLNHFKTLIRVLKIKLRKARAEFRKKERSQQTRYVYIALTVGTVMVALLMVLLNRGIFALSERNLFDRETYETVEISASGSIAEPLSRKIRVGLYGTCTLEGVERAPLPEEMLAENAIASSKEIWSKTLELHAVNGTLRTGESVERVLNGSKYTAKLRDFFNEENGTKLAIWSTQSYYKAKDGRVYCLSLEMDSRTMEPYSMTVALFENIDGSDPVTDFYPFLEAIGESKQVADSAIITPVKSGSETVLSLTDGTSLTRYTEPNIQIYLKVK